MDIVWMLENEAPSREIDEAIQKLLSPGQITRHTITDEIINVPEYTKSLDAARKVNPGWFWRCGEGAQEKWAHLNRYHLDHCDRADETHATALTVEMALCAASIKARRNMANHGQGLDKK